MPTCWIIAGPNGAGKTTFALNYLPNIAGCRNFINADLIAAGLSPLAPEKSLVAASRLFLREIEASIARREDFAFETTLSGRGYLKLIRNLRQTRCQVILTYLALPDVELCISRVAERVAHGGHHIPEQAIRRRFPRSLCNLLHEYSFAVDQTRCYLNTGHTPILVFEQQGAHRGIADHQCYQHLMERAGS